jgi:hypothetical protein
VRVDSLKNEQVKMAGDLPEDLVLVDVQSMQSMLHGFCLHDPDTLILACRLPSRKKPIIWVV